MLADNDVADSELAQLPVHVVDEAFRESRGGLTPRRLRFHPQHDEREDRGDHVEAAVDRVGHLPVAIPVLRARALHDRGIKWQRLVVLLAQ
jgi:hypothetical protein